MNKINGYQPDESLDKSDPPQGGSGVVGVSFDEAFEDIIKTTNMLCITVKDLEKKLALTDSLPSKIASKKPE